MGPPGKERPGGYQAARPDQKSADSTTNHLQTSPVYRQSGDGLAAMQRRRAEAVRMAGGDPESPGTRYHKPHLGQYARGLREGFAAGAVDTLRIMWPFLSDDGRAKAQVIASRHRGGGDDD